VGRRKPRRAAVAVSRRQAPPARQWAPTAAAAAADMDTPAPLLRAPLRPSAAELAERAAMPPRAPATGMAAPPPGPLAAAHLTAALPGAAASAGPAAACGRSTSRSQSRGVSRCIRTRGCCRCRVSRCCRGSRRWSGSASASCGTRRVRFKLLSDTNSQPFQCYNLLPMLRYPRRPAV